MRHRDRTDYRINIIESKPTYRSLNHPPALFVVKNKNEIIAVTALIFGDITAAPEIVTVAKCTCALNVFFKSLQKFKVIRLEVHKICTLVES